MICHESRAPRQILLEAAGASELVVGALAPPPEYPQCVYAACGPKNKQPPDAPHFPVFPTRRHNARRTCPFLSATTREGIETDSSEEEEERSTSTAVPTEPPLAEAETEAGAETVDGPSGGGVAEARLAAAAAADARSRAANAALRRLAASQHRPASDGATTATAAAAALVEAAGEAETAAATGVVVVAPTTGSSDGSGKEKGNEEEEEEVDIEGLTEVAGEAGAGLLAAAGVRTIGQLADRDEEELTRLVGALQAGGGLPAGGGGNAGERVQSEKVAEWVQAARGEELDEIMADIVEGDDDVVEVRRSEVVVFLSFGRRFRSVRDYCFSSRRINGCTPSPLQAKQLCTRFLSGAFHVLISANVTTPV